MRKNYYLSIVSFAVSLFMATPSAWADGNYKIYPIPQQLVSTSETVNWTPRVRVICEEAVDTYTKKRLEEVLFKAGYTWVYAQQPSAEETNIYLGINGSGGAADLQATTLAIDRSVFAQKEKFDRHQITLVPGGNGKGMLMVLGEHTNAVFFGLASVEQMLEQQEQGSLACVSINDYADLQYRGVVEGYYGYPWTYEAKKDLMAFFKRFKMNTYIYGAKSDPYHSGYWEQPYPVSITAEQHNRGWMTQDMMKEIAAKSLETKVNFIWAVHPGMADAVNFSTPETTESGSVRIFNKLKLMHDLGVRQFAVFLDDCGNNMSHVNNYAAMLTSVQNKLEQTYNKNYQHAADTVMPLHYVPHLYALNFASASDMATYFAAIGKTDPKIAIHFTGSGVWSRPANADFTTMKNYLGRKPVLWWNYPCNDNADNEIYMADMYTTMSRMRAGNLGRPDAAIPNGLGVVSNPMQQGQASKVCLFSIADYCWNTEAFNSVKSWEHSFAAVIGHEKAAAFRYFSEYVAKTEPTSLNTLIQQYKNQMKLENPDGSNLVRQMDSILWACHEMRQLQHSTVESDRLLYADLKPWINKLSSQADRVKGFVAALSQEDEGQKWNTYLENSKQVDSLNVSKSFYVSTLEGTGKDAPKAEHLVIASNTYLRPFVDYLHTNAWATNFPKRPSTVRPVFISNIKDAKGFVGYNKALGEIYLTSPVGGIKMPHQGYVGFTLNKLSKASSVAFADSIFENYQVSYSIDGKTWNILRKNETIEGYFSYLRIQNMSERTRYAEFGRGAGTVNLPQEMVVSAITTPNYKIYQGTANNLKDGDYNTCLWMEKQANADAYTLKLNGKYPIHDVRVVFAEKDRMAVGKVQVSADGTSWTDIKVKGKTMKTFTESNLIKYADGIYYVDLDGDGIEGQYVRFYNQSANTNYWFKLHEIEVNKVYDRNISQTPALDMNGKNIEELSDELAYTNYKPTSNGFMTYRFIQNTQLENVKIYADETQWNNSRPMVKVTLDGQNWIDKGELTGGVTTIDMTDCEHAIALKIQWTLNSKPAIYEICEKGTAVEDLIDGIGDIEGNEEASIAVDEQGRLRATSDIGIRSVAIYTVEGSLVAEQQCAGKTSAVIPLIRNRGTVVVHLLLMDGTKKNCKILR